MKNLTIIGAGAWGTALAYIFRDTGIKTLLWSKNPEIVDEINSTQKNSKYSGDTRLTGITATTSLEESLKKADIIINALPAYSIYETFTRAKPHINPAAILINASKATDPKTHKLPNQIFLDILSDPSNYFSLSGPGFAAGLLNNHPTTINIAGKTPRSITQLKSLLKKNNIYLSYSNDVIGVEWGGIYKNIVAIAAGFAHGLGHGENTNALIFSAGFKEMVQSGIILGAKLETFYEPCGVGDLMLSTSSMKSRNYSFGFHLTKEADTNKIFTKLSGIAEGYYTLQSINYLKTKYNLSLPLSTMLYNTIFHHAPHQTAFTQFLETHFK